MTGTKSARSAMNRARIIVHFRGTSQNAWDSGHIVLQNPGALLLNKASLDLSPDEICGLIAEHRDQRNATGEYPDGRPKGRAVDKSRR